VGKNTLRQAHAATSPAGLRGMESQHGLEGAGKSLYIENIRMKEHARQCV
jgi:hypothetical protein